MMKIRQWWKKDELIAMIPNFEEFATKYLEAQPKKQSEVAKLREELAALKAKQAEGAPAPPAQPPT
jgi:hypothetical protein